MLSDSYSSSYYNPLHDRQYYDYDRVGVTPSSTCKICTSDCTCSYVDPESDQISEVHSYDGEYDEECGSCYSSYCEEEADEEDL